MILAGKAIRRRYKRHQAEKNGQPVPAEAQSTKEQAASCPQCGEKSKIDFAKRDEGGVQVTDARCVKCGMGWRYR